MLNLHLSQKMENTIYRDYGAVDTPQAAQAALKAAISDIVTKGGGVLIVPPGVTENSEIENNAPSSVKAGTSSIAIIDRRSGYERILPPPNGKLSGSNWSGVNIKRTVRQPIDMNFGMHSTQAIDTNIAGGTVSYIQPTLLEAKKGKNQKIYVPTIRGLFVGMSLNLTGVATHDPLKVKELGWDAAEEKLSYIVADLERDHPKEAFLERGWKLLSRTYKRTS